MERKTPPSPNELSSRSPPPAESQPKRVPYGFLPSLLVLFALWILFSGRFDAFHLSLGLMSSVLVSAVSGDLLFAARYPEGLFGRWLRLAGYFPWLIYQIFIANLHVMYLVFHPRMIDLINPQIIEFDSRLNGDWARALFANSITLTPGTLTVDVTALGRFSVHCIDDPSGQSLPGEMEEKIASVFKE